MARLIEGYKKEIRQYAHLHNRPRNAAAARRGTHPNRKRRALPDGDAHAQHAFPRTTTRPCQSYLRLPEKLHIPFTLRLRAALDDQALYILIGRGHVAFATGLTENRPITDILGGDFKPRARGFDNELSLGRPTALEITYTAAAMWVRVDGELRCLAQKESYQKALKKGECADAFAAGFDAALACDKETTLTVYELSVTEYDGDAPAAPPRDEVRPLLFSPAGFVPARPPRWRNACRRCRTTCATGC